MVLCFSGVCGGFVYRFEAYCEEIWVCWEGVDGVVFVYIVHVGFGFFGEFGAYFVWPIVGVCYGITGCNGVVSCRLAVVV